MSRGRLGRGYHGGATHKQSAGRSVGSPGPRYVAPSALRWAVAVDLSADGTRNPWSPGIQLGAGKSRIMYAYVGVTYVAYVGVVTYF